MDEARKNDEVISLADSQILRWVDELNGITDADERAREIKSSIKKIKRENNSVESKKEIKKLYAELDKLQFKPDYLCLIIDKKSDYTRACKGFTINGIKYKRLLGTNGGIKNSTIVFMNENIIEEIARRIDNGRDMNKKFVPAKLEAYKALTCSASVPVSLPKKILVVDDLNTAFKADIVYLSDENSDKGEEPIMETIHNYDMELDATDGFGIMLPSLAERWSEELKLGYTVSGLNTRFSFCKGMLFTFDFLDFAENVANKYMVKDAWGDDVDIREVEAIFTTSMIKLWDSYKSCQDYIDNCVANGYNFGVAKTCPEKLENERNLNYQFIQSYELDDDDIEELIAPTMNEIKDVLGGDWKKTLLFLKGMGLDDSNIDYVENDFTKAIMLDRRVMDDTFVRNAIYDLIKNRINQAKVGVLKVHGNYSIICGDPYALCQHVFGLEITGLLKSGEIYNGYWADYDAESLACFRAPMTCHNNIRLVSPVKRDEARYWYKYIKTGTVFNAWDTACAALNGCDFDGDLVMLTDNSVLVNKLKPLPALKCIQKNAQKIIPTESDFISSNIESFGNEIGQITNWITSMFEVRSRYEEGTVEHDVLSYRIKCGQLYQQNAIDKAKGIISNPMPKEWHDRHAVNKMDDFDGKELYRSIVADRKPYFMRYIYPSLMKQYNTYIKNTDKNALREFQMTVAELKSIPKEDLTERQAEFLKYYDFRMPVGVGDCVMNKICRRFEEEFDGYIKKNVAQIQFDHSFMRNDTDYTYVQRNAINKLYKEYNNKLKNYAIFSYYERVDEYESFNSINEIDDYFRAGCEKICPNEDVLSNILLDICYSKKSTRKFVWSMVGDVIIKNLIRNTGGVMSYPVLDDCGDISYGGERFSIHNKQLEVV